MDKKAIGEWVWRGVTAILIPTVMLGGGWIWTTHSTILQHKADAQAQLTALQKENKELKERVKANSTIRDDVIEMKVDIRYIRETQSRIEASLASRKPQ